MTEAIRTQPVVVSSLDHSVPSNEEKQSKDVQNMDAQSLLEENKRIRQTQVLPHLVDTDTLVVANALADNTNQTNLYNTKTTQKLLSVSVELQTVANEKASTAVTTAAVTNSLKSGIVSVATIASAKANNTQINRNIESETVLHENTVELNGLIQKRAEYHVQAINGNEAAVEMRENQDKEITIREAKGHTFDFKNKMQKLNTEMTKNHLLIKENCAKFTGDVLGDAGQMEKQNQLNEAADANLSKDLTKSHLATNEDKRKKDNEENKKGQDAINQKVQKDNETAGYAAGKH